MIFVYFQNPNERNTSKMEMSDNRLVLTKSPKILIRATIVP